MEILNALGSDRADDAAGRLENYAVGYFESWSLESLQGVVDAAEEARAVILGFNGAFLSGERRAGERLALYAALGRAAAESSTVPCGLNFNECPRDDWVLAAIDHGFNLVMLADPAADPAALTDRVAAIHARRSCPKRCRRRRGRGASLWGRFSAGGAHGGSATDPALAARFVTATGVDLLAVSVGNIHIKTSGEESLDLALLEEIHDRVPVPLVLHGGTGISARVAPRGRFARSGQGELRHVPQTAISCGGTLGDRVRLSRPAPAAGNGRPRGHSDGWPPGRPRCRPRANRSAGVSRKGNVEMIPPSTIERFGALRVVKLPIAYTPGGQGSMTDFLMRMPDLATVDATVTVVAWLKEPGEIVKRGEPLLEVETDKAILPVESPVLGVLCEITALTGAEVATGQVIALDRRRTDGRFAEPPWPGETVARSPAK